MNALRRAVGRKESLTALFLFLLASGWFGWRLLAQSSVDQLDQPTPVAGEGAAGALQQAQASLDSGQYSQVIAQLDAAGVAADQSVALKYKALAQAMAGDAAALETAESILSRQATGPDAAIASGLKTLLLLGPGGTHVSDAALAANLATQQAGQDADAQLVATVARAAVLRSQLDQPGGVASVQDHLTQLRQALGPVCQQAEPQAAWKKHFWRRALATLVDSHILAAEAGETAGETQAISLMRQSCPADTWACHFTIPQKALTAAQAGALDDHARLAMYTAAGYLYTEAGDRVHCDHLLQRAIRLYGKLLEDYDGWTGDQALTTTPQGKVKTVGIEFYDYRDRQKRLVRYSADWWGIRVLEGTADLSTALGACDVELFRAMVRLRTDRQTDPIVILQQERTPEFDYFTAGQWFQINSYPAQADWEQQRGQLIQRVGQEECQALDSIAQARTRMQQKRYDEALALLRQGLQTEPTLAETGVSLRCEAAGMLVEQKRYEEALASLDEADRVLQAGDARLAYRGTSGLQGRISYYRLQCARGVRDNPLAVQLAEQLANNQDIPPVLQARALLDLVQLHIETSEQSKALEAYGRLAGLPVTPEQSAAFLQAFVQVAQSRLSQKGWYQDSQAGQG